MEEIEIVAKYTMYECDRCHEESKSQEGWRVLHLPTGKDNCLQNWFCCPGCVKNYADLLADQEGQRRAFVAGAQLPESANMAQEPDPKKELRKAVERLTNYQRGYPPSWEGMNKW